MSAAASGESGQLGRKGGQLLGRREGGQLFAAAVFASADAARGGGRGVSDAQRPLHACLDSLAVTPALAGGERQLTQEHPFHPLPSRFASPRPPPATAPG